MSSVRSSGSQANTLYHAIEPFLLLSQFFGVLPVAGFWPGSSVQHVKFRWMSVSLLLALGMFCFSIFDFALSSQVVAHQGLKIYTIGSLSFSVICIACFGVFLLLSRNLPHLLQQTAVCELVFAQQCYDCQLTRNFSRTLRRWGICLLLAAFLEHCTYISNALYNNQLQIRECNLSVEFWRNYFMRERPQFFQSIEFSGWLAPFIVWTTLAMTFAWNFVDIFLVLVCRATQLRFKQLHWRIQQHNWQHMPNEYWAQVRNDLLDLSDLLKLYDKELSALLLLSCSHNMYFLCVQIYHSFQAKGTFVDELYFWISLLYVLSRLLNMMFAASSIPLEARHICHTLYEIPTEFWCQELRRLCDIVITDEFSLSGKGFFFLTRRLIFAMAGTLVVYELVLINQLEGAEVTKHFCTGGVGSSKSIFN